MLQNYIFPLVTGIKQVVTRGMCIRPIFEHGESNLKPVNLSYKIYDTYVKNGAPPLVIMHGLLGSKQNWNSISKALVQKLFPQRKIITVDARNHGESPHSPFHTYPHLVEDIVALLKQLNVDRVAVLGHSMGGRAMMYMALKYPKLVERAIIVDISPITNSVNLVGMENIFQAIKSVHLRPTLSMTQGREKATIDLLKVVNDKATVDFIVLNLKKHSDGNFAWKVNVEALHSNFKYISCFPEDVMKTNQFHGPVLFIGGSKSDFIKESDLSKIKVFLPNSTLQWLDTGHLVQLEKPSEFIRLVVEFLN